MQRTRKYLMRKIRRLHVLIRIQPDQYQVRPIRGQDLGGVPAPGIIGVTRPGFFVDARRVFCLCCPSHLSPHGNSGSLLAWSIQTIIRLFQMELSVFLWHLYKRLLRSCCFCSPPSFMIPILTALSCLLVSGVWLILKGGGICPYWLLPSITCVS